MGMKAEQWRQIILSFESKKTYNNPFLDVSIWSVFTGPSGRRIRREAYWDGGNTYRIAFAPTEIGMLQRIKRINRVFCGCGNLTTD